VLFLQLNAFGQLYFLSTRRNPTGEPICAAEIGNPEGLYALQVRSRYLAIVDAHRVF